MSDEHETPDEQDVAKIVDEGEKVVLGHTLNLLRQLIEAGQRAGTVAVAPDDDPDGDPLVVAIAFGPEGRALLELLQGGKQGMRAVEVPGRNLDGSPRIILPPR